MALVVRLRKIEVMLLGAFMCKVVLLEAHRTASVDDGPAHCSSWC